MTTDLQGRVLDAIEDSRIELELHVGDLPPDVYARLRQGNRALRVAVLGLEPVVTMGSTYENDLLRAIATAMGVE